MPENRTPARPKSLVLLRVAARALLRPRLLLALLATGWYFRRRDWFRRPPFLPLPPADYMRWRMHTAYGSHGAPTAHELEAYVLWAARMRQNRPLGES